jgi:S1-C subfamily serine protease
MPAVVSVHTYGERNIAIRDPFWQMFYGGNRFTQKISAMGSGVIIDSDGIVVTNDHVISLIKDSSGNYQGDIRISLVDGRKYDAEVVKSFPHQDVAILRVDGGGLPYIDFASSANVVQGQTAIAIGNPFGASLTEGLSGGEPTVTRGVVSATKRSLTIRDESGGTRYYRNMIQTDASINSGNSGGALVDINGDLIGINSTIFTAGGKGSIGIGFAIPSDRVQLILDHMQRYGDIGTPYFGIESVSTLTNEMMDALDLTAEGGVIINDIDNNSPADRAGLKAGDVILGVNGLYVTNAEEIISQFRGAIPGETFELLIFRRGEYRNIGLKIGMQE